MFTPDSLLDLAIAAETVYRQAKPDTAERHDAHYRMDTAFICALWMENNAIAERRSVGPFGGMVISAGMQVRIRKGAVIAGSGDKQANRTYIVTAHRGDDGYAGLLYNDMPNVRHQHVYWSGRNGWRWTEIDNVELVTPTE